MDFSVNVLATLPMWFVAFLFSLTCHEAAHALVAKLGGDLTAYHGGQVSLDPIPHIRRHPFGTIIVPIISFFFYGGGWMIGWGSMPLDPSWVMRHDALAELRRAGFVLGPKKKDRYGNVFVWNAVDPAGAPAALIFLPEEDELRVVIY